MIITLYQNFVSFFAPEQEGILYLFRQELSEALGRRICDITQGLLSIIKTGRGIGVNP